MKEADIDEKCVTETPQILVREGYWIWWCKTHNRPLGRCNELKAVKAKEKELMDVFKGLLTPFCCHTSGMHDPQHFEKNPNVICRLQKSECFDRAVKYFKLKPVAIPNPSGCGWCESKYGVKK